MDISIGHSSIMMTLANESASAFWKDTESLEDRKLFVQNLGILLSQTRERIVKLTLDDHDIITILYKGGSTTLVNVSCNSYAAIISDVINNM